MKQTFKKPSYYLLDVYKRQAYKLDFINDMADSIGKSIQTLAGVTQNGFSSSGFYVGFLLLIILVAAVSYTHLRPCYQRPYGHFGYSRACGKMQETGIYRKVQKL